jgi:hypothetical protein
MRASASVSVTVPRKTTESNAASTLTSFSSGNRRPIMSCNGEASMSTTTSKAVQAPLRSIITTLVEPMVLPSR